MPSETERGELTLEQLREYLEDRRRECAVVLARFMGEERAARAEGDEMAADRAWESYKVTNSRYNLYQELLEIIRAGALPND